MSLSNRKLLSSSIFTEQPKTERSIYSDYEYPRNEFLKKNNLNISYVFISIVLYKCYHYHNVYWVYIKIIFHFIQQIQVPVQIIIKVLKNDFSRVYFIRVSLMSCFLTKLYSHINSLFVILTNHHVVGLPCS